MRHWIGVLRTASRDVFSVHHTAVGVAPLALCCFFHVLQWSLKMNPLLGRKEEMWSRNTVSTRSTSFFHQLEALTDLSWIGFEEWERQYSLKEWSGNGTGCPGGWWSHHHWRCSRKCGDVALRDVGSGQILMEDGWLDWMISEVFSNLDDSMILWLLDLCFLHHFYFVLCSLTPAYFSILWVFFFLLSSLTQHWLYCYLCISRLSSFLHSLYSLCLASLPCSWTALPWSVKWQHVPYTINWWNYSYSYGAQLQTNSRPPITHISKLLVAVLQCVAVMLPRAISSLRHPSISSLPRPSRYPSQTSPQHLAPSVCPTFLFPQGPSFPFSNTSSHCLTPCLPVGYDWTTWKRKDINKRQWIPKNLKKQKKKNKKNRHLKE